LKIDGTSSGSPMGGGEIPTGKRGLLLSIALAVAIVVVYYLSSPATASYYDYTFRIAGALINGRLGTIETPPSWLNEMVPLGGEYYSVFPLGSILTMLPVALLHQWHLIDIFPGAAIAAIIGGALTFVSFHLATAYEKDKWRVIVLALFIPLGTWTLANLAFGGAWQLALGFALLGQLAALYFILVPRRMLAAGLCFAIAAGNRTEIFLVAPVFAWLIMHTLGHTLGTTLPRERWWRAIAVFVAPAFVLGLLTLAYNQARFSSPLDFGYARIPGVLDEPWYQHGIFSIHAIPLNAREMLFEPWRLLSSFPYIRPGGFGGSIFLSSPALFLLFRRARDEQQEASLIGPAWCAIAVLTLLLWCHGNPGGWQYSYRYAMVLLPWMFMILLRNSPPRMTKIELLLFIASFLINAWGSWLFLHTDLRAV
jgi:hypothetical protein